MQFTIQNIEMIWWLPSSTTRPQKVLDALNDYCHKWKLQINLSKTKVLGLNKRGKKISDTGFHYDSNPVKIVTIYI